MGFSTSAAPGNSTIPSNETETFWEGITTYYKFGTTIVDRGGMDRSYIYPATDEAGLSFTTQIEMPNMTSPDALVFFRGLYDALRSVGIAVSMGAPSTGTYGVSQSSEGSSPANSRFGSRLFPRANWDSGDNNNNGTSPRFAPTMRAIRATVEAGYTFHGLFMGPTKAIAGFPGRDSGVNPAFRTAVMHADVFDYAPAVGSAEEVGGAHERLNRYMDMIRAVTPGSGAYTNEADVLEPDWQASFWGGNYPRLLEIKKKWDPSGVFWAPATVGSEGWEVATTDGLPSQNGRLCRVE